MATAKLTDTHVSKTKPNAKAYTLSDGKGLILYVTIPICEHLANRPPREEAS